MAIFSIFLPVLICIINLIEPVRLQNARYKKSTIEMPPEEEMCNWLIDQCPFLKSTARPVYKVADQVIVTELKLTGVKFLQISDLDQKFSIQGKFDFTWKLPDCAIWNEELLQDEANLTMEAKKVQLCYFDRTKMWHPIVRFRNSYTDPLLIVKNFNDLLVLKNDGYAILTSGGIFEAFCPLQFLQFPFDEQVCSVAMFSSYPRSEVVYNSTSLVIPPSFVVEGDIWLLLDYSTKMVDFEGKDMIFFQFKLKRKQQYYYITIFLTIELLIALQITGILMHPGDSNRSAYSITVILGFSISQSIFTSNIPKTSQFVYLFVYIGAYMAIGSFVTIYSLVIGLVADSPRFKNKKICNLSLLRFIDVIVFCLTVIFILLANAYYFGNVIPDF